SPCLLPPSSYHLPPSLFFSTPPTPPLSPLFPSPTLFRSQPASHQRPARRGPLGPGQHAGGRGRLRRSEQPRPPQGAGRRGGCMRSEEHTSELQSLTNLVCRLLLEKKKHKPHNEHHPYTEQ